MVWQSSVVVVSECLEGTFEILLQDARRNNLLALLTLWTRLGVVLAHVFVVSRTETNDTLLALVAYIDSYKHCLLGNLRAKVKSPEISSELGVDLSQNVDIDSVVVFLDSFA